MSETVTVTGGGGTVSLAPRILVLTLAILKSNIFSMIDG